MMRFLKRITAPLRPDERSRRIAEARLREGDTRLHLILASVLCLSLSLGALYLTELVFLPLPWQALYDRDPSLYHLLDAFCYALEVAFVILIILPLVFGTARIFHATAEGDRLALSELFSPFRSGRSYRRAMLVMLLWTLPRLFAGLLIYGLCSGADGRPLGIKLLLYALALLLFAADSLLFTLDSAVLPLAFDDDSLGPRALWRTSALRCYDRMLELWRFKLGYLGWGLLSVLSLGTLLICHTLPLYALARKAYTQGLAPSVFDTETGTAPKGSSI